MLEPVAVAAVGLLGVAEARVLAHRPQPPGVHRRLHPAGERVFARETDVPQIVEAVKVGGIVFALDLDARAGGETLAALAAALERGLDLALLPILACVCDSAVGHVCGLRSRA